MQQIVLQEIGNFQSREIEEPVAAENEALVKIHSIGVCGTDLHAFAGRQPFFEYPRVLGHELGVEVLDAPAGSDLKAGDLCALEPYIACGKCHSCSVGRSNCCEHLQVLGVHADGGMQSLFAIAPDRLFKSDKLSTEQLALVETLGIGANAVKRAGITPGENILIVGAGPIGLAVLQFAAAAGANVAMLDVSPNRLAFAESLGARPLSEVGEERFDVVFDATGNKAAMEKSFDYVHFAGKLVLVGLVQDHISFHDPSFHRREMTLLSSRNSFGMFPEIISMIETGKIDTDPWINQRLALADVPSEFALLRQNPELIKAVIDVD